MNWLTQLFSRRRELNNISEEIAEHLEEKVQELVANGMSREESENVARREFGNVLLIEEHSREAWQWRTLETILRDLKYALRQLRRNPGFTFVVVLTLSFAIGANTAVFSMINAMLLRPLPYSHPDRLGSLMTHYDGISKKGDVIDEDDDSGDGETLDLLKSNVSSVISGAYAGVRGVNLQTTTKVRYVQELRVSAGYFPTLGIPPMIGRTFSEEEDRPNGPKVVILSYELWKTLFDSDSSIVGQAISLKGEPHTVIGVLPIHTQTTALADLWTPLRPSRSGEGSGNNYGVILRLRNGATWAQADTELATLRPELLQGFEKREDHAHAWFFALPMQQAQALGETKPVFILMAAVGSILLIACANLAGLMLVRISRRNREIATRLALGATTASVTRQILMEPMLLAFFGGFTGILVAFGTLDFLATILPTYMLPVGGFALDARVLAFAMIVSACTSLLIGLLPLLELRHMDIRSAMGTNLSFTGVHNGKPRTRQALIAAEVALTVVLLAGAGLLLRTLVYLKTLPPGFDGTNVMTAKVSLDDARYHDVTSFQTLLQQSLASMKQIPSVESAAVGLSLPFERGMNDGIMVADGPEAGIQQSSSCSYVTPEYFRALRIAMLAGRPFNDGDTAMTEPVMIVNEAFSQKILNTRQAVGRHLRDNKHTYLIVGMVADVTKTPGIDRKAPLGTEPVFYMPATQISEPFIKVAHIWFQPSWIVRTNGSVAGLPEKMQEALAQAGPTLPFSGFHSLSDLQADALQEQRVQVFLLGTLSVLAVLLSVVGVYGLVSNMIVQRTREIGIRMALGSTIRESMFRVSATGLVAVAFGLVAGTLLALLAVRVVESQLFGIGVYDPITFASVLGVLLSGALLASLLPTLRIARIDPASILRAE